MEGRELQAFEIELDVQLEPGLWNALVKFRANYSCEDCGYAVPEALPRTERLKRGLHAHHIDSNHSNNSLRNGAALCLSCHARATRIAEWARGEDRGARASRRKG